MNTDKDGLTLTTPKGVSGKLGEERAKYAEYPHERLTHEIIGATYEVHRELGGGFLEKVYENALAVELRRRDLHVRAQDAVAVRYKGVVVGEYLCDLLVNETVLCEIKALEALNAAHSAQLLNYLRATGTRLGLLLNFGPRRVEVKRVIN
jgi:GxxExxY protein